MLDNMTGKIYIKPPRAFYAAAFHGEEYAVICEGCADLRSPLLEEGYNYTLLDAPPPACDNCGYRPAPVEYELYRTLAPKDYDGFGTWTLAGSGPPPDFPYGADKVWRIVAILPEHKEWQLCRYASGWNATVPVGEEEELP